MPPTPATSGTVVSLWRYPVKSMMGEELNAAEITDRGLRGDRAYALVDGADGKVASAKNPRKWPQLFDFRAAFVLGEATLEGESISTTFVEFEILNALARSPGRVFTRDMLLARVWGDSA